MSTFVTLQVQTVEAGIKEVKGVFEMHHLKVRSAPGLYLQEQFAVFAANFALGGTLAGDAVPTTPVRLARHDTAEGERAGQGRRTHVGVGSLAGTGLFVKVHGPSIFAGWSLELESRWAVQLPMPSAESSYCGHF